MREKFTAPSGVPGETPVITLLVLGLPFLFSQYLNAHPHYPRGVLLLNLLAGRSGSRSLTLNKSKFASKGERSTGQSQNYIVYGLTRAKSIQGGRWAWRATTPRAINHN